MAAFMNGRRHPCDRDDAGDEERDSSFPGRVLELPLPRRQPRSQSTRSLNSNRINSTFSQVDLCRDERPSLLNSESSNPYSTMSAHDHVAVSNPAPRTMSSIVSESKPTEPTRTALDTVEEEEEEFASIDNNASLSFTELGSDVSDVEDLDVTYNDDNSSEFPAPIFVSMSELRKTLPRERPKTEYARWQAHTTAKLRKRLQGVPAIPQDILRRYLNEKDGFDNSLDYLSRYEKLNVDLKAIFLFKKYHQGCLHLASHYFGKV